jgi:serine/threonine-protein kinase
MLSKGQKINDRYEIVKSIGEGGMANVYLANDTILERKVAVKVLRGDLSADDKFIRRFEREAQSVSNLSHPNIVEVYDVGVEDNQHYIVMEYIEGKTLKQLLKKRETLTLTEVIDIMTQLTDGMSHAHESYIIHRDIKPQNIMIQDNGLIKITDFGIAMALNATQLTQTNSVMGSVHYLPPEQASGKGATIKSDIYSLGILMYELLTGNVPFKGDNAVEIALKHMKDKIPSIRKQDPSIPQAVENILIKAAAKNPRNRYDSISEMHEDFIHCLDEEHANDKKIVFEYPENDLDGTETTTKTKKTTTKKIVEKTVTEDTDELATEIVDEELNETIEENIEEEDFDSEEYEEPKKKNTLLVALASFFLLLLITGGIIWLVSTQEVEDITVPDVVGYTYEEAVKKLKETGFKIESDYQNSDTVEEGLIIKTKPKAGSTRKKGDTIIVIESSGGVYNYLENYVGLKYAEVKAKLELLGLNVIVEKKDIEDKEKYKDKEDIIIEQSPKYDETKEKVLLEKGDTITLYIPNIINEYPDMINEGWTLNDVIAFTKEYKLNLTVYDSTENTIPANEYSNFANSKVIYQQRQVGDTIINGISFYVRLNAQYTNNTITPDNNEGTTLE